MLQPKNVRRCVRLIETDEKVIEFVSKYFNFKKLGLIQEVEKLSELVAYKDFDDESAQLQYWTQKFEKELVLTQTLGLPPNPELLKSCLALPSDSALKKNIEEALLNANKKLLKENN